jgi:hypothetical protein
MNARLRCPSCFETPRIAAKLVRAACTCLRCAAPQHEGERVVVFDPGFRSTRPGHESGVLAQPVTLAAAALLGGLAPASGVGESSASSARLIVA